MEENWTSVGKYSVAAIFNRSGSSILGKNKKWGTFYGLRAQAALGEHVNVRASYGVSGNLPAQGLLSQQIYRPTGTMFFNGRFTQSYGIAQTGNPDLQWQESQELTIGFGEQNNLTDRGNPLVPGMDRHNAYPSSRAFVIGVKIGL